MKAQRNEHRASQISSYQDGFEHLHDELMRLDKLLEIKIHEFNKRLFSGSNQTYPSPHYVSNDEVTWLMSQQTEAETAADETINQLYDELQEIEDRIENAVEQSLASGVFLPLVNLSKLFNMTWLEYQVVLICLAPELRRRYDRIYAYLQDDIARKRPSLDLVLQICCASEPDRWQARQLLNHDSNLIDFDLIQVIDDIHSPSGSSDLSSFIRINKRILDYILGVNIVDRGIKPYVDIVPIKSIENVVPIHAGPLQEIRDIMQKHACNGNDNEATVIHLLGREGYGKKTLILRALQHDVDALLVVDASMLYTLSQDEMMTCINSMVVESILLQTPIYFRNITRLREDIKDRVKFIFSKISRYNWVYFSDSCDDKGVLASIDSVNVRNVRLSLPAVHESKALWDYHVARTGIILKETAVTQTVAEKFILSPLAIKQVINALGPGEQVAGPELMKKCQSHSNKDLIQLATKIPHGYSWEDIVLPDGTRSILQTICKQVNNKYRVFHDWGFDNKLRYGRGLSVLFCGSPGTGKTMAAQVIATELKLDLYKIDLSNVVSKYIGETEKNLDKVFTEAETSNAVLFFDECDALFGKRTEVSDAHDRYANLEVSFLLQKMEEYDGIVILATNLRGNMDDAFIRRIRFIVEFPFPDQESRKQIWCKSLPELAPVSEDIDFDLLAKKLKLSGGNIKNIVLNAAFHASDEECTIAMKHMLVSARDEFQKIGKSWNENIILN